METSGNVLNNETYIAKVHLNDGNTIHISDENEYQNIKERMKTVTRGNSPFVYLFQTGVYINVNYITFIEEV